MMAKRVLSPADECLAIQKKLGYLTLDPVTPLWLDTGSKRLNAVLGSRELGIAYGKLYELSGPESNGKTLLALLLAGLAQQDGAVVGWAAFEGYLDTKWAEAQGLDATQIYQFEPKIGTFGKDKTPRLQTAEEVCTEIEMWMAKMHARGEKKIFLCVDSVTAMLVEEESEGGLTEQNMRTNVGLSRFLSKMLRRWVALSQTHGAMIFFINQLRTNIGIHYGNPETTTGGRALRFYASIRAQIRRIKGGKILQAGKMVGLKGIIKNYKNKAGGGSMEGEECGFKAFFMKQNWRFVSADKMRKDANPED
jgi:recombination protein RecA